MKSCPCCAEENQDDAKVGKPSSRSLTRSKVPAILLGVVAVFLGIVLVRNAVVAETQKQYNDVVRQEAARIHAQPIVIPLGDKQTVNIPAGSYEHWDFILPTKHCSLSAHVEGVSGGNQDFEGVILNDDNFKNWQTKHEAQGYAVSGRVAAWSPTAVLAGPGAYHLVVSNVFSLFTGKVVTMTGSVTCLQD